jgi:hypothetical protein
VKAIGAQKVNVRAALVKIKSGQLPFLVLRSIKTFANESYGFVRQARRKPQR